ncbi:MAG TPA: hypothetical protein VK007_11050 [Acidimicrobiales bacterium]|nr:hypothetical protein [Acidimicrobiales bacterium]
MSQKRPSKQKRAARNRQQRAALEARKAAARREAAAQAQAGDGGGRGGRFSRRRAGGATPASTSRRPTLAEARALQPPGYRAALAAIFTAVVAIIMLTTVLTVPSDGSGNPYTSYTLAADWVASAIDTAQDQPGLTAAELADAVDDWTPHREEKPFAVVQWPLSITLVLPLIGAGLAFHAVRRRASSRALTRALYTTLFGSILALGAVMLFIPTILAVVVAMFQVRKVEMQAQAEARADGVIDVDSEEVDDDEDDEAAADDLDVQLLDEAALDDEDDEDDEPVAERDGADDAQR